MAIGVTARTAFSFLMPPLIDEFGWDRDLAARAFSFGFLVSAVLSPLVGRVMDTRGPRVVIMTGVALLSSGLLLAPYIERDEGAEVAEHDPPEARRPCGSCRRPLDGDPGRIDDLSRVTRLGGRSRTSLAVRLQSDLLWFLSAPAD
jgi:hypothetical protein